LYNQNSILQSKQHFTIKKNFSCILKQRHDIMKFADVIRPLQELIAKPRIGCK